MGAALLKNAHEDATPPVLPKRRSVPRGAVHVKKKRRVFLHTAESVFFPTPVLGVNSAARRCKSLGAAPPLARLIFPSLHRREVQVVGDGPSSS